MNLMDRATSVTNRSQAQRELRKDVELQRLLIQKTSDFDSLARQLKELVIPLESLTTNTPELRTTSSESLDSSKASIHKLIHELENSVLGTCLNGNQLASTLVEVQNLLNSILADADLRLSRIIEREFLGIDLNQGFAAIPGLETEIRNFEAARNRAFLSSTRTVNELIGMGESCRAAVSEIPTRVAELKSAREALDNELSDLPEGVGEFLNLASRGSAPLALYTESVKKWIHDKKIETDFRILLTHD
jgi:hypothetical protein